MINSRPFTGGDFISGSNVVRYFNDDNPSQSYNTTDLCFVSQPIKTENHKYNNVVVPLMMGDMWSILQDNPGIIHDLRCSEKKYEFGFIGSCVNAGRSVLRHLELDSFLFETDMTPIWSMSTEDKHTNIKNHLYKISQCKFVFAPRGVGSSSFRLYESLSVGSIPIVTGAIELPFEDQVQWDEICLRGDINNLQNLAETCSDMSDSTYYQMRERSMDFWDYYCRHDRLYDKLLEIINDKNNRD